MQLYEIYHHEHEQKHEQEHELIGVGALKVKFSIQETKGADAYLSPYRMHSQVNLICDVEINITIK